MVMDVSPFPSGRGFQGGQAWWDYVLNKDEQRRLNDLVGVALLDESVCDRLVNHRDDSLLRSFGLSATTREWLKRIPGASLQEFAKNLISSMSD